MRQQGWVAATAALVGLALTGCGSTASASEPTAATAVAALSSVVDSASARSDIVINNFGAIWRAAGLPAEPSLRQFASQRATNAIAQTAGGTAIGSDQWEVLGRYPAPLGYRTLAVRVELDVAENHSDDGEVWGPINPNRVLAAVKHLKSRRSRVGQSTVLDFGPLPDVTNISPEFGDFQNSVRYLAVNRQTGRVVEGGKLAAEPGVTALANATHVADPVSADPTVAPLLRAFGTHVQSMVLGTGFINGGPFSAGETPAEMQRLLNQTGISRLPAGPLMVGLAYTGGPPTHQSVLAAALYPSAADAQAAVATVGKYTKSGFSHQFNMPYSRLWHVTSDTAQGRLVTLHLTTSNGAPTRAIIANDFPLFWQ